MKKLLHPAFIIVITIILVGSVSCNHNGVGPSQTVPHFTVIFRFVDVSDSTIMSFGVHGGVYFPKQDSSTYAYTGESVGRYGWGKYLIGHVVEDSIGIPVNGVPPVRPYPGVKAGLVILAKTFWDGDTSFPNVPKTRAWHLKERTITNPDSNVISFTWPKDTLSPIVEYIGYVNQ